ncbi:DUF4168 domain-containing protein [Marinospirillum alkaliphilum]|uniref:DUF4168 domain-containing protein n=1 Tax=Marinospirillum alkaliphilum DSM 21637 TaxID=1122209 RepID=A0A1K1Z5M4_9GAMM|nr:DUF4168 domain-containing protein [Marinospirillum alkaliphilum]SFX69473.1 protein of unknown function [Marinospirillum alkaliphilum DSM 21637]
MKKLTGIFVVFALMLGFSVAATAQQAGTASDSASMAPQHQAQVEFSDVDLEKFVGVQGTLEEIRQDYTQRLEAAGDQEAANRLQQEAGQLMVEAVQDEGLDVETYNQIAMALQTDQQLRDRVESMMN